MSDSFEKCSPVEYHIIQKSNLSDSLKIIGNSSGQTLSPEMEDELFDKVMCDLMELQRNQLDCREKLDQTISSIEQYPHMYPYLWVFIILYPDILLRFLRSREYVNAREYSSAIARCVQHHKTAKGEEENWYASSLQHLLKYKEIVRGTIELKILPGVYPIDRRLYGEVRNLDIRDRHYENEGLPYEYKDVNILDEEGTYVGHRDCYHALSFGDELLASKYIKRALEYDDCTGDAIKDYVGISKEADLNKAIGLYESRKKI